MKTYNQMLAVDYTGNPVVFKSGQKYRIHTPYCKQTDGMVCTVKSCFDQTGAFSGPAVILEELSWCLCNQLEPVGIEVSDFAQGGANHEKDAGNSFSGIG